MTSRTNWEDGVSIIVPTYKRPEGIVTALQSLFGQSSGARPLEIVVADNDPAGSAREAVLKFAKTSPIEIHYIHVPEPGVSNARNGAMMKARGRYRAFLDDDMEASPVWLSSLLRTTEIHNASVCFGPIDARMPAPDDPLNIYMQPYFSRSFSGGEGPTDGIAFGMGGSLLDMARCDMPSPPFNTDMNETGGEDDWLFEYLMHRGANMTWAPEALTYEHVPASRLTKKYFWNRNFAYGQGPTQIAADRGFSGAIGVVKWMCVGAVQTVMFAPVYSILRLARRPSSIAYLAKLAQGVGKVFWWGNFRPRMYGSSN